jgi:hypothetical protein
MQLGLARSSRFAPLGVKEGKEGEYAVVVPETGDWGLLHGLVRHLDEEKVKSDATRAHEALLALSDVLPTPTLFSFMLKLMVLLMVNTLLYAYASHLHAYSITYRCSSVLELTRWWCHPAPSVLLQVQPILS